MLQKLTAMKDNIILARRIAMIAAGVLLVLALVGTLLTVFSMRNPSDQAGIAMINTGLNVIVLMGVCGGVLLMAVLLVLTVKAHHAERAWQRWGGALVQLVFGLWMMVAAVTMANKVSAILGFLMLLASGLSWFTAGGCSAALLWLARQSVLSDDFE